MRPQLLVGGLFTSLLGALLYLVGFFADMGVVFVAAGLVMAAASPLLPQGGLPVQAPPGYRYCVFCSSLMQSTLERCPKCDGVQPKEAS